MKCLSLMVIILILLGCAKETVTVTVPSSYAEKMVGTWDFTTQTIQSQFGNIISDNISKDNIMEFRDDGWGSSTLTLTNFTSDFQWAIQENPDSLLIVQHIDGDNPFPFDFTKVRMFNIEVFDYDMEIGRTIVYMTHIEEVATDSIPLTIETRYVILKDD